jgi:hypothetical protein
MAQNGRQLSDASAHTDSIAEKAEFGKLKPAAEPVIFEESH